MEPEQTPRKDSFPPSAIDLMRIGEVSDSLGLCEKTVWNLIRGGRIRSVRIGRAVRIRRSEVAKFLEACEV